MDVPNVPREVPQKGEIDNNFPKGQLLRTDKQSTSSQPQQSRYFLRKRRNITAGEAQAKRSRLEWLQFQKNKPMVTRRVK